MRRQRSLRRWLDNQTGMTHTHIVLDPEADARFSSALDAAVAAEHATPDTEERTWEQLQADALVELVTGARSAGCRPAEVSVLIDYQHPRQRPARRLGGRDRRRPTRPTRDRAAHRLRRHIIPIVLNGHGVVLDQGHARRVATVDQRRALRAMHRTCGHPACTVRFDDCQIHHVIHWIRQRGPTNLDNLLPLCTVHHHLVHEGGWHLTLQPDRTITLTRPDGTVSYHGTEHRRHPRRRGPPTRRRHRANRSPASSIRVRGEGLVGMPYSDGTRYSDGAHRPSPPPPVKSLFGTRSAAPATTTR